MTRLFAKKFLTPVAVAFSLSVFLASLASTVPGAGASTPAGVAPYQMEIDADGGTAGVQPTRNVSNTARFSVGIQVTAAQAAYVGYQWEIEFPPAGLAFVIGSVVENTAATTFTTCAPAQDNSVIALVPGDTVIGNGAGCIALNAHATRFLGQTTTFDMQCISNGTFTLRLLDIVGQDSFFGSDILGPEVLEPGGTGKAPATASASITCSGIVGVPSGPTRTPPTAPVAVVLTAEPSTIPCDEVHTSTVTATVTDAYGARVRNGWRVDFTVLGPSTTGSAHTAMTENGMASFVFTPPFGTVAATTIIVVSGTVQTSIHVDCLLRHARDPMPVIERYGGQLSIGTPLGKNDDGLLVVPVNTTAAGDPYYGFALHLEFDERLIDAAASDFTPTFGGSTLDSGDVPGFDAIGGAPDVHSVTAQAWKPGGRSTRIAGTMTHIRLRPRPGAVGCSYLHLVTFGAPDGGTGGGPPPALGFTGSYTINAADGLPQVNRYGSDAGVDVQTGKACIASAPALPRSGTGDARGSGLPLLAMAAMLCSLAAGTGLVIAGRAARRRRLS